MQKMDLDPSLAFTALIELAPGLSAAEGEQWKKGLLAEWYKQDAISNFWRFARQWAFEYRMKEEGRLLEENLERAGNDEGLKSDAWERYFEANAEAGNQYRAAQAKHGG